METRELKMKRKGRSKRRKIKMLNRAEGDLNRNFISVSRWSWKN